MTLPLGIAAAAAARQRAPYAGAAQAPFAHHRSCPTAVFALKYAIKDKDHAQQVLSVLNSSAHAGDAASGSASASAAALGDGHEPERSLLVYMKAILGAQAMAERICERQPESYVKGMPASKKKNMEDICRKRADSKLQEAGEDFYTELNGKWRYSVDLWRGDEQQQVFPDHVLPRPTPPTVNERGVCSKQADVVLGEAKHNSAAKPETLEQLAAPEVTNIQRSQVRIINPAQFKNYMSLVQQRRTRAVMYWVAGILRSNLCWHNTVFYIMFCSAADRDRFAALLRHALLECQSCELPVG